MLATTELDSLSADELVHDREKFSDFIYTPLGQAVSELKLRWVDESIQLPAYIPKGLEEGFRALYSVCVVTPNYEVRRLMGAADAFELEPYIFERKHDKYVPQNNAWKYRLGRLALHQKANRMGHAVIQSHNIINFNEAAGKRISDIQTDWGQPLHEFHHELFFDTYPHLSRERHIFDNSDWFYEVGGTTKHYYEALLPLTIKHGILFDNFMLDDKELAFTRDVFLPAFIKVYKETGLKPLIVALEPTEVEGEVFWLSHPAQLADVIDKKRTRARTHQEGYILRIWKRAVAKIF